MSEIATSVTVDFTAPELDEPFELVTNADELGGARPVQVARSYVDLSIKGNVAWVDALKVDVLGTRRVKLFCSERVAATARLTADHCTVRRIGRRIEPVTEALTWSRDNAHRIRWFYDRPEVAVIEQTSFRDLSGAIVDPPRYDPATGTFHSPQKVIGAMVVRYNAGFSLYEVTYGNGREMVSASRFAEMQQAWRSGDVEASGVPPVRVLALSDWHATQGEFQRKIWPNGDARFIFRTVDRRFGDDSDNDKDDDSDPEDTHKAEPIDFYTEIHGSRKTITHRIYNPNQPQNWVDVEKTVYLQARNADTGKIIALQLKS